jgi:CRP-like cAMP-binding protein
VITTVEKVLFLKGVPLFADIPGEELAQLALIAEVVDGEAGQDLVREGDQGDALYLVVEGDLRVLRGDREVSRLGERDVFGEMALLDPAPRSATVRAASDVRLLRIQREDFLEILAERTEIARGVMEVLVRRLREATGR